MGGGTGLSNIASSMYAAASMNNAASATVTAQASPEIHNAAAEPTLLEKAHNILDILGCFSDIPDGINALLYLYEGNQKEAVLCAICFLPFGDAVSKGRKVALNAIPEIAEFAGKHADDAVDAAKAVHNTCGGKTRVRHYTNSKGLKGIKNDGTIFARDNNRVYLEPAKKKPLSPVKAQDTYQIKQGKEKNYVEFDVDSSSLEWVENPRYHTMELTIKGDVKIENPVFVER